MQIVYTAGCPVMAGRVGVSAERASPLYTENIFRVDSDSYNFCFIARPVGCPKRELRDKIPVPHPDRGYPRVSLSLLPRFVMYMHHEVDAAEAAYLRGLFASSAVYDDDGECISQVAASLPPVAPPRPPPFALGKSTTVFVPKHLQLLPAKPSPGGPTSTAPGWAHLLRRLENAANTKRVAREQDVSHAHAQTRAAELTRRRTGVQRRRRHRRARAAAAKPAPGCVARVAREGRRAVGAGH